MAALKQMTVSRLIGSLLLAAWVVWLFNYSVYYFSYGEFAYAVVITALLASLWLGHLVSNQKFGLRIVALLVPYLLMLYWLVQQNIEAVMPDLFAGLIILAVIGFIAVCFSVVSSVGKADAQLLAHGEKASAKVLAVEDTNVTLNGTMFLVWLSVEVSASSKGPFTTKFQTPVSRVSIPRVGDTVTVIFNPANPESMALFTGPVA